MNSGLEDLAQQAIEKKTEGRQRVYSELANVVDSTSDDSESSSGAASGQSPKSQNTDRADEDLFICKFDLPLITIDNVVNTHGQETGGP